MADQSSGQGQGMDQSRTPPKPSQAEGDRATIEQDLAEKGQGGRRASGQAGGLPSQQGDAQDYDPQAKPSQAEGERSTVDEDLRQKQG